MSVFFVKRADAKASALFAVLLTAAACLHYEGLAVSALVLSGVVLVCADLNCVERAIVDTLAVMLAACYCALDAFIRIFVHPEIPP